MSEHRYVTSDVFTDRAFGGNHLAVFPDATGIPDDLLLTIAREFNFSETTFCYPPENPANAARVRIFTPGSELQFAGHPTVGSAIALCTLGLVGASKGESEIVLARDGQEQFIGNVRRVGENRELVSSERAIGEDVVRHIAVFGHQRYCSTSITGRP